MNGLTTEQLAEKLSMRAASIRSGFCRNGSYFGLTPLKLPNGRLLWPADSVQKLLENGEAK
ncbi:hypothetical protein SAMN05216339_10346 [Nitrosomonas eutropha]|uniref:DNA-binding protein n=1 Tax=Nitrosomonas eutropha TaxID=916 RepID=A0A1I7GLW4_9PROT|nr:hypothetical protein [Nitrosomonas eutropha]SFU49428.1 hypothetical protein SAMN05216339_10346 [Nitrosomonas eutropha]